jgi:uridine kinase
VQFILADYPRIAAAGEHLLAEMRPGEDWFLGGLARSGKSTLAAALARELRRRDRAVVVINLDRWVKPEAERGPTVFGRFDMAGLSGTVGRAAQRAVSPVQLDLPAYSRRLKRTLPTCHLLNLPPNAVVLWEGVVALELARLVGGSARTIHVDTDEFERRVRFHHYDARRGIGAAASTIAWRIRDEDEHALLRDMADSVKHRISLDGLLTVQDRPQGDPA